MLQCIADEQEFEKACLNLNTLPSVPPYWARMRKQNQEGPKPLGVLMEPPPLSPATFKKRQEEGALMLDVRQPAEWQGGHVPGARHISGAELPRRADEVPRDRPVAVYCGSGYRSSVAASLLKATGHKPVYNVLGGFTAWKNRDLPIEQ